MTLSTTHASDFEPHNNPCAQCGKPIAKPVWSEPGERCVTYVWACQACDYEFTSTAVFAPDRKEHPLAA
jgi:ribosomal protein L37AE/L43A